MNKQHPYYTIPKGSTPLWECFPLDEMTTLYMTNTVRDTDGQLHAIEPMYKGYSFALYNNPEEAVNSFDNASEQLPHADTPYVLAMSWHKFMMDRPIA